ncbi:MAG: type II toxin-antitoxin system Phd/YefM family antitoxin [Planctomycetes bacterium]|nr:type II toxin-antitoxin system Phd/YefM family antitoxin [Planctomycetota bacterium]
MKTVNVRNLQRKVSECVDAAQKEAVVVTRHGQPAAIVIGVEGDDWEDVFYRTSPAFWKMIEERRRGKTIPLAEMRRRLDARWARQKPKR